MAAPNNNAQYGALQSSIGELGVMVAGTMAQQKGEIINAVRAHMRNLQRDVQEVQTAIEEKDLNLANDERVRELEKERDLQRRKVQQLERVLHRFKSSDRELRDKVEKLEDDRGWLTRQLQLVMQRKTALESTVLKNGGTVKASPPDMVMTLEAFRIAAEARERNITTTKQQHLTKSNSELDEDELIDEDMKPSTEDTMKPPTEDANSDADVSSKKSTTTTKTDDKETAATTAQRTSVPTIPPPARPTNAPTQSGTSPFTMFAPAPRHAAGPPPAAYGQRPTVPPSSLQSKYWKNNPQPPNRVGQPRLPTFVVDDPAGYHDHALSGAAAANTDEEARRHWDAAAAEQQQSLYSSFNFPCTLHEVLSRPDFVDIIEWSPHGRSWQIYKPDEFERKVLPHYFRYCKTYAAFIRKLNGWGFRRIRQGPDHSAFFHEMFLRGLPHLSSRMRHASGGGVMVDQASRVAPNFHTISQVSPLPGISLPTVSAAAGATPVKQPRYNGKSPAAQDASPTPPNLSTAKEPPVPPSAAAKNNTNGIVRPHPNAMTRLGPPNAGVVGPPNDYPTVNIARQRLQQQIHAQQVLLKNLQSQQSKPYPPLR